MNRVKKKSVGSCVLLKKKKKHCTVESDNDSYDSMIDNGTDEDNNDNDDDIPYGDQDESPDSGHGSGAYVFISKPTRVDSALTAKGMSKVAKRKVVVQADEEAHRKRLKTIKDMYKPPTVEEINRLKETENYYHSNLFRMQTEQMLKEVRVPPKIGRFVQRWLEEFKEFLQTIDDGANDRGVLDLEYKGIPFPLQLPQSEDIRDVLEKERFLYVQQHTARIIGGGGAMLCTSFGKPLIVDLVLAIPDKCFHKDDYLNLRYHCKRAHYLCTIAERLLDPKYRKIAAEVRIEYLKGDHLKPILVMIPSDEKLARKVQFHLLVIPEGGKFPTKRLLPDRNNVRPRLIGLGHLATAEEYERFPTPHYNSSILHDLRLLKNADLLEGIIQSDSVRDAIILLKVWARQRGFDQRRYGFDGGLITFYIAHLLHCKRIYQNMSSYQIVRLFWNQLAGSSWDKQGVSFDPSHRDAATSFFRFYDVVFLDPSGELNLTANLPVDLYRRVRHESVLAIRLLDNRKSNCFLPLFLASYSAFGQYDHLVTLNEPELIPATINSFAEEVERLDYICNSQALFTRMMEKLLRRGLGTRITYLVPLTWKMGEVGCTLGISLNGTEAFKLVDKGPEAIDTTASEEFRAFWAGKAELRRFKDGSITESCVWGDAKDPIGQKRLIVRSIVLFLLNAHYDIPPKNVGYVASQFEAAVQPWRSKQLMQETVEERTLVVLQAFDSLSRILRDLDKLPLTITAVVGTDSVFRYTDPDPPGPTARKFLKNGRLVLLSSKPIHATIQLEASGKWPEELEAIRRLKTAFYLRIANSICALSIDPATPVAQANNDYLDVLYKKFLFRFVIIHHREISLLREYFSKNKVTRLLQDTDESIALEMQATILPKLSSVLHGLHQQHFSFGSVGAIAKRWLYAQLIDSFLWPDECTELLLASLFINQPLQPPIQPQAGFLRWLQYVGSTDWNKEMIVVNFNDELSGETIDELEKRFIERRDTFPPLTIVTSCDEGKFALFGRRAPTMQILNRVSLLAKAAIEMIDSSFCCILKYFKNFFQPCFEGYDVIIHLHKSVLSPIGIATVKNIGEAAARKSVRKAHHEFDPARFYLRELREAYKQFAIFFYDPCGGDRIAVLWRPDALEAKSFTTSNVNGRMLSDDGTLRLNVDALVRDFEFVGKGVVKRVDRRC